jgi:hypothetical protein
MGNPTGNICTRLSLWERRIAERGMGRSRDWWLHPRGYVPDLSAFPEEEYPTPCMHCGATHVPWPTQQCPVCRERRLRSRDLVAFYVRRETPGYGKWRGVFVNRDPRRFTGSMRGILIYVIVVVGLRLVTALFPDTFWWLEWLEHDVAPGTRLAIPLFVPLLAGGVLLIGSLFYLRQWLRWFSDRGGEVDARLSAGRDVMPFGWRRAKVWAAMKLPKHAQQARERKAARKAPAWRGLRSE